MSLNDRDWYRRATGAKPLDFVQLPLPYMGRRRRSWRWLRRALRSEWFNVFLALAVVVAALVFIPGCASAPPCEARTTAGGLSIPAEVVCIIDRPGGAP